MEPRRGFRLLLTLAAVLVGLLLAYWRWGGPEERSTELPSLAELYGIAPEEVQEVRIHYRGERPALTLRREGHAWTLLEPVRAPANPETVQELLELLDRPIRKRLEHSDDKAFGLDNPVVRAAFRLRDGRTRELWLGNEGVSFSLYLREREDPGAVLVESWYLDRFQQPVSAFRSRQIWGGTPESVAQIAVRWGTRPPIVAERSAPTDAWRLQTPADRADAERIDALLRLLQDLTVVEFLGDGTGIPTEGPKPEETVRIRLETFSGETNRYLLWPEEGSTYRLVDREAQALYRVEIADASPIPRQPDDWRDRRIAEFQRVATDRVEIFDAAGTRVVLERSPNGEWKIVAPTRLPADGPGIQARLSRLDAAQALRFLSGTPPLAERRLRLWDGSPPQGFTEIGFGPAQGNARPVWSSRRPGTIGLLPEELGDDWPADPAAYRERVALRLEPDRVQRVELLRGPLRVVAVREGLTWRRTEPEPSTEEIPTDGDAVDGLLVLLNGLEVVRWVAKPPQDAFHPSTFQAILTLHNLHRITLTFGQTKEGLRWGSLSDEPMAFLVDEATVRQMEAVLNRLRGSAAE